MANPNTAQFPGAIPDDTGLTVATDNFFVSLISNIGSGDTSFALSSTAFNTPAIAVIDTEYILIGSVSGSNATSVSRGFLGTTAAAHNSGSTVFGYIFAYHHNQVAVEIEAICTLLGIGGANFLSSSSSAGGDLSGTYPNPNVAKVNGKTALTIPFYIDYRPGYSQGGTPVLALDTPSSSPAVIVDSGNSNTILALAKFTNGESDSIQGHFYLPPDITGAIDIQIIWQSPAIAGNVQWNVSTAFSANFGTTTDPSFNAAQSVTTTVQATTLLTNSSTISALTQTGISSGGIMFWKLSRTNGGVDTLADVADVAEIIFTVRRSINY